jgi:hypothetical protein
LIAHGTIYDYVVGCVRVEFAIYQDSPPGGSCGIPFQPFDMDIVGIVVATNFIAVAIVIRQFDFDVKLLTRTVV